MRKTLGDAMDRNEERRAMVRGLRWPDWCVLGFMAIMCALCLVGACTGCGGQSEQTGALCTLSGTYEMTTEGCGTSYTWTGSHDWVASCYDGDVCDSAVPATFCSFVVATGDYGCRYRTTVALVE